MRLRSLFVLLVFLVSSLFLVQCQENSPTVVSATDKVDLNKAWTEKEIVQYLENFDYPENRADYQRQFFGNRHRSQLTPLELAEVEAVEQAVRQKYIDGTPVLKKPAPVDGEENFIESSSVYFYCTHYDNRDDDVWDDANSYWGNMAYEYTSGYYFANTQYMTVTADVWECYEYLYEYADRCDFTYPFSSTSGAEPCEYYGWDVGSSLFKVSGEDFGILGNSGGNSISSVPGSYVFSDLNPSLEDWTSGRPDAFFISMTSPYNIPSLYHDAVFLTTTCTQSATYAVAGTYSARIQPRLAPPRAMASGYFEIPSAHRLAGDYYVYVWGRGNTQGVEISLSMSLYGDNDALLGTTTRVMDDLNTTAWEQDTVMVTTAVPPKYIRVAVVHTFGTSANYLYFDSFAARSPAGDYSLPVEYMSFYSAYLDGSNFEAAWYTTAELNNALWKLYYYNTSGDITLASSTSVLGAGNTSETTYYSETFPLNAGALSQLSTAGEIEVFLGITSYSGEVEYLEDDSVLLEEY